MPFWHNLGFEAFKRGRSAVSESIRLRMMGHFAVEVDGRVHEDLAAKSRKGISLIQYLIMERGKTVSSQRLIREMWAGRHSESPENALKTMVSRVRAMLREVDPALPACLVSGKGGYSWENAPGVTVDALEIMEIYDGLREDGTAERRAELTDRLLTLYAGDLYQTGDLNNGLSMVNWMHREYLDAVLAYVEQLKRAEEYNRICEVCRAAIRVDDLDEQLHIELMQAMVNLNRASEAMAEYRKVVKVSRDVLDAEPSEELQACYAQLAEAGSAVRFNLDVIRNELAEQESDRRGPFFCDYRAFKEIYNIQMRNLERLGSTMFLGVIMLGEPGDGMSSVSRESGMAGLQEILRNNLRKGDIVTRFSDSIYAMLLPTVNYETGSMVVERIEHLFYTEYPARNITFHARISPLGGGR